MSLAETTARSPGVVYTKPWVARFMLDLAGYTADMPLGSGIIIEPGCGTGNFLVEIVPRLLEAADRAGQSIENLERCIYACDTDLDSVRVARQRVIEILMEHGQQQAAASNLADAWICQSDFLADPPQITAAWIVGNPPYVRVEEVGKEAYAHYRATWSTMTGRSDLYIGFFEASLALLAPEGVNVFICADRWMRNQYGASLRKKITNHHAVDTILDMHDIDVFEHQVSAYPAITVLRAGAHRSTIVGTVTPDFDLDATAPLLDWIHSSTRDTYVSQSVVASHMPAQLPSTTSWPAGPPERLALVARLETTLTPLEEDGIRVRVGLATGADKVFITYNAPNVELDRLMPVVSPADIEIHSGTVSWKGRFLVSPWIEDELVDIASYPWLHAYYDQHEEALRHRHVAQTRTPWWRTIDRPRPHEYAQPKLLIADIDDRIEPVLDRDGFWPLHSTYYIVSDTWDLEVLGGYLLSKTADDFVRTYSVKLRRNHIRISAQYLRKIRIPRWSQLTPNQRNELLIAFKARDREAASDTVDSLLKTVHSGGASMLHFAAHHQTNGDSPNR